MSYKKALSLVDGEVIDQVDQKTGIAPAIELANSEVYDTGIDAFTGSITVSVEGEGAIATCHVASSAQVISGVAGSSVFSGTEDTASSVNVFVSGGTIQIQNLTGSDVSISARLY